MARIKNLSGQSQEAPTATAFSGAQLPFWVEDGHALHTAFTSLSRLTGIPITTAWRRLGVVGCFGDLLGFQVKTLASTVFPGKSLPEIQRRHTLLPIITAGLTLERAETLWAMMRETPQISKIRAVAPMGASSRRLSFCLECAAQDAERRGIPGWWISHQIPLLGVCLKHRSRLLASCGKCGGAFSRGGSHYLPGEPCRQCGALPRAAKVDLEPGADRVLNRLIDLVDVGELHLVRPHAWRRVIHSATYALGGEERAIERIGLEAAKQWPRQGQSICAAHDIAFPRGFVGTQMRLLSRSFELLQMLVVLAAIEALLGADYVQSVVRATPSDHIGEDEGLELLAAALDLPMGAARLAKAQRPVAEMCSVLRCQQSRVEQYIRALPEQFRVPLQLRMKRSLADCKELLLSWKRDGGVGRPTTYPHSHWAHRVRRAEPAWLDKHLPLKTGTTQTEEKRRRYRAETLRRFSRRDRVYHNDIASNPASAWLYTFDREWLCANIPYRPSRAAQMPDVARRTNYRRLILTALREHPGLSRVELSRGPLNAAVQWTLANDRAWLESQCPSQHGRPRKSLRASASDKSPKL